MTEASAAGISRKVKVGGLRTRFAAYLQPEFLLEEGELGSVVRGLMREKSSLLGFHCRRGEGGLVRVEQERRDGPGRGKRTLSPRFQPAQDLLDFLLCRLDLDHQAPAPSLYLCLHLPRLVHLFPFPLHRLYEVLRRVSQLPRHLLETRPLCRNLLSRFYDGLVVERERVFEERDGRVDGVAVLIEEDAKVVVVRVGQGWVRASVDRGQGGVYEGSSEGGCGGGGEETGGGVGGGGGGEDAAG